MECKICNEKIKHYSHLQFVHKIGIKEYLQFGFECIVIWGKELKEKDWESKILGKLLCHH